MQYTALDDVQISREGWAQRGHSRVKQEGLIWLFVSVLSMLDASHSATELLTSFTAGLLENFGSRYTHLENVVLQELTYALFLSRGHGAKISSGVIVRPYVWHAGSTLNRKEPCICGSALARRGYL